MENDDSAVQYAIGRSETVAPGVGIDLEFDADVQSMSPEASEYETCYVTSHKGPCRVATYSRDGQLIATGSADASIKILDTERMLAKSAMPLEVSATLAWSQGSLIFFFFDNVSLGCTSQFIRKESVCVMVTLILCSLFKWDNLTLWFWFTI